MKPHWLILLTLNACSKDDETQNGDCSSYEGAMFLATEGDIGTISGTLIFPEDLEEGLFIEMGLEDEFSYQGAMPESWDSSTCGTQMDFVLNEVPAGDYTVVAMVQADEQPDDDAADTVYVAEGGTEVSSDNDDVSGVEIVLE